MTTTGKIAVPYSIMCCLVLVVFSFFRAVLHVFLLRRLAIKFFKWSSGMGSVPEENYTHSLFGWQMYKAVIRAMLLEMRKPAKVAEQAPNPSVFALDSRRKCNLLEFAKGRRPLVVNFGSCTCPIFMAEMDDFAKTIREFGDIADFLVVYVNEAHPTDGWAFKNNYDIRQHRSMEDRFAAAELFRSVTRDMAAFVAVDTVDEEATKAFGALPIRQCVIQEGKLLYSGGMGPVFYRMHEIRDWLVGWRQRESSV